MLSPFDMIRGRARRHEWPLLACLSGKEEMMAKPTLRERVLAHAKQEPRETRAQEKRESPAFQRMERKLGVEMHTQPKPASKKK